VAPTLLSVVELGGYPDFTSLYRAAGFEVVASPSVRRALSLIKGRPPQVVVAEFNFQSDFRDRTSNLETLLAALQVRSPGTRTIVFYEPEHLSHLQRLTSRFSLFAALPFPVQESDLVTALHRAAAP
jgi:hypothetical protein